MRSYILKSIIKRDVKEILRNPATLLMLTITLCLNVFISTAADKGLWVLTLSMCLVMIGFYLTSFMITEEKEKKTLEALLVSPASYNEILFGKLFLTTSLTIILTYLLVFTLHFNEISFFHSIVVIPFGALTICLIGTVVGLICHSQAMLSGVGTFLMLLLFLPELMAPLNKYIGYLARSLPTHHIIQIVEIAKKGEGGQLLKHYGFLFFFLLTILLWVTSFVKGAAKIEGTKWIYSTKQKVTTFVVLITCGLSAFLFAPVLGEFVIGKNGNSHYVNEKYKISLPLDSALFETKEFPMRERLLIKFKVKDSKGDYIYLSIKENKKGFSFKETVEDRIEKIKKKGVIEFKQQEVLLKNGLKAQRFSYFDKDNKDYYFVMSTKEKLFKIGLDISDKNYEKFVKILNQSIIDFEVRNPN